MVATGDPREAIFASIAGRLFSASLIAVDPGMVTPIGTAVAMAEELGLSVEARVDEGAWVVAGEEILRVRGTAKQTAMAEERLIGALAKPSGIATATSRFVERAGGGLRIVSGAWKKLPFSQKEMLRGAIAVGGADPRIATPPFVYLDKNFVAMLGGPELTMKAVADMDDHRKVIQIEDPAMAEVAARGGADIVFVDTGHHVDVTVAATTLREAGLRERVELAFGGGVGLEDIDALRQLDLDIVDVGRPIVDAPLLDLRLSVLDGFGSSSSGGTTDDR
jgi:nicotinate-nucleotide pyrophosphorylase (carboxylating)